MTKYVCKRNEVCGGLLLFNKNIDDFAFDNSNVSRGILFSKDDNGYANDLIYDVEKYPIKGLNNISADSYFVNYFVELEELLRYLGYRNDLTQSDLNRIYKKFILHSRWLHHNKELFGLLKMYGGSYGEGGLEMVSIDIYNALEMIEYSLKNCNNLVRVNNKLVRRR